MFCCFLTIWRSLLAATHTVHTAVTLTLLSYTHVQYVSSSWCCVIINVSIEDSIHSGSLCVSFSTSLSLLHDPWDFPYLNRPQFNSTLYCWYHSFRCAEKCLLTDFTKWSLFTVTMVLPKKSWGIGQVHEVNFNHLIF